LSKLGGLTAFAAEAALWVTGAALIAGAAGMHWNVDLPKVDLLTPQSPNPALVATASPITSAPIASTLATSTPAASLPAGKLTVAQKLKAFLDNPGLQLEVTMVVSMKITANGRTLNGTEKDTIDYSAGAVSKVSNVDLAGLSSSNSQVSIGDTVYYQTDGSTWATMKRPSDFLLPITLHWENRVFIDKGVEKKSGRQLHRLEATDATELIADYQKATGFSNVKLALVYWADNNGMPVYFNLSGSYTAVVKGVTENVQMTEAATVVKTSGVTVSAPY
jgi:hypothetical protein